MSPAPNSQTAVGRGTAVICSLPSNSASSPIELADMPPTDFEPAQTASIIGVFGFNTDLVLIENNAEPLAIVSGS